MPSNTVKVAMVTTAGVIIVAAITGGFIYLGQKEDVAKAKPQVTASATSSAAPAGGQPASGGTLELVLPGNGILPWTHYFEVQVKNVSKQPFDEVQVGVHNKQDKRDNWNFYNCNATSMPTEFLCPEVVAGDYKDPKSKGPWVIAAVVVDPDGKKIITDNRPALAAPNLLDRFGSTVKASGARDARRE
ncbi:hypothetical protein [Paractinoplanes brasiliensis]|uniref:Uncharacterized protein n=1 Tax=Paractinoplanes brasiliensis TaxID=52695 RepID=A0A4R6JRB9_9ACTN|nr:hypothetical protein [Actinoplanes brasiliensis]TDO38959.1 hypothetical protein C8E87_2629 [Actinoplanes brasiliensis]GID33215.1 hypothetical protein Abr02nite_81980 [Actinoplanes brasiliensis]